MPSLRDAAVGGGRATLALPSMIYANMPCIARKV
jgi:hypothetical protein